MTDKSSSGYVTVFVTAANKDEAEVIARTLVQDRLVACANVMDVVTSYFRWEGKVQTEDEVVLLAKSRSALFPDIEARVKELHSYDCPCIVAWPIEEGSADYLAWIEAETKAK